jgi:RNA polymerase sigma-70 factor (ECF subfamily)
MLHSSNASKEALVEQLLLTNYDRYYRLAYSYVHNDADAGDIVQNAAYKAIRYSNSLKKEEFAGTWIYRIVLNEIYSCCKRDNVTSLEEIEYEKGTEDVYENVDLKRALDDLPVEDKAIIEMRYFEDMKLEEIAKVLEENLSTVKSRLYRGLKKLKIRLTEDEAEEMQPGG